MGRLFGTDGIRGIANQPPVDVETGMRVGRAVVEYFRNEDESMKIVIGRDTRLSGPMLEHALCAGILSTGADVLLAGELPTPAVALLTRDTGAHAGIVISASHNPYQYNGFKIFSKDGFKLSDREEAEIEDLILLDAETTPRTSPRGVGSIRTLTGAADTYIAFLRSVLPDPLPFEGLKIVLDCGNGATFRVAPAALHRLGADVEALFIEPDGMNINHRCGSQFPEALSKKVREIGADAGLAFDGDGDRMIAVDEEGTVLSGDQILTVFAQSLKDQDRLSNNTVVSTVMSNLGLRLALEKMGVSYIPSKVGDRYVMEEMKKCGAALGGEDSGHFIFLKHHTTGDGILSAVQLLSTLRHSKKTLSSLAVQMTVFPQSLVSIPVKDKPDISTLPSVMQSIKDVEEKLGNQGRVLVRYSGTEPVCRIMVEGPDQEETSRCADLIAEAVRLTIGA